MDPILLQLADFDLTIRAYWTFITLAVLFWFCIGRHWAHRLEGLDRKRILWASFLFPPIVFLGGRLHHVLIHLDHYGDRPIEALRFWAGGFHAGGAILALLILAPFVLRRFQLPLAKFADALLPSVGIGIALARLGCFLEGCCFGHVCDLPWAVRFPENSFVYRFHKLIGEVEPGAAASAWVHPLQLYFVLGGLAVTAVAIWVQRRKRYDGQAALAGLFTYAVSSALLEFFRADQTYRVYWGSLPQLEWMALGLTLGIGALWLVAEWKQRDHRVVAVPGFALILVTALLLPANGSAMVGGSPGASTGDDGSPMTGVALSLSTNLFTGAASASIAIEVPPGRSGAAPNLVLGYSSQAGHGVYGEGWALPLGRVQRSARFGIPAYDDSDTFLLILPEGSRELVRLQDNSYAVRIDDAAIKVTRNPTNNTWTAHDKSGRDYIFGNVPNARVRKTSTTGFHGTFAWHLTQIQDPDGNTIDFEYEQQENIVYPDVIRYGANPSAGMSAHPFSIVFDWDPRERSESLISYASGFRREILRRLVSIEPRYDDEAIRRYEFRYLPSPGNGRPLLSEVLLRGRDGDLLFREDGTPASTKLSYHDTGVIPFEKMPLDQVVRVARIREEYDADVSSFDCVQRNIFDIDGDGQPDMVISKDWTPNNPRWKVYRNQGTDSGQLFAQDATDWPAPDRCIVNTNLCNRGEHTSCLGRVVLDVNGDGLPDWIDAAFQEPGYDPYYPHEPWYVHLNTGTGFDPVAQDWGYMGHGVSFQEVEIDDPDLRHIVVSPYGTVKRPMDLNGDGLPEVVMTWGDSQWMNEEDFACSGGEWEVHWNTGTGFLPRGSGDIPIEAEGDCIWGPSRFISISGRYSDNRHLATDVFDLNGDGLPDKVQAQGEITIEGVKAYYWKVFYGNGAGFDPNAEFWESPPYDKIRSWNDDPDENGTRAYRYDTFDITGDGLPDFVSSIPWDKDADDPFWEVWINTGRGFKDEPVPWAAPNKLRRQEIGGESPQPGMKADTMDLNGDGFVDHIQFTANELARVWLSQPSGPADALAVIENAAGGRIEISYAASTEFNDGNVDPALGLDPSRPHLPFSVWTVSRMEQRLSAGDAEAATTQEFGYRGGYFDRERREFRGFHRAWQTDVFQVYDPNLDQDREIRSTQRSEFAQTEILQGRALSTTSLVGDPGADDLATLRPRTSSHSLWGCHPDINSDPEPCDFDPDSDGRYFPRLISVNQNAYSSLTDDPWIPTGAKTSVTTYTPDACAGNLVEHNYDPVSEEVIETRTTYAALGGGCNSVTRVCDGICTLPASIEVVGGEKKNFEYDANDRLHRTYIVDPANESHRLLIGEMLYEDGFGNLTEQIDAHGVVTEIAYDATRIYAEETVLDPGGLEHRSQVFTDPGFGKATASIDVNGHVTVQMYDAFGRQSATIAPGQSIARPTTKYDYQIGKVSRVDRFSLEPGRPLTGGYLRSTNFVDALGRPIGSEKTTEIGGQELVLTEGTVAFGPGGRIEEMYPPRVPGEPTLPVLNTYDEFGRLLRRTNTDGHATTTSYKTARVKRACDARHTALSSDGSCTEEELDAFGRVIETRVYYGNATVPAQRTRQTYDPGGRLIRSKQFDASGEVARIVNHYDVFGRAIETLHPDSGRTRQAYNDLGQLIYQDDPEPNQHLEFEYDNAGRLTHRYVFTGGDEPGEATRQLVAHFTYDSAENGIGQPAETFTYIDTDEVPDAVAEVHAYHPRGGVLSATRTIRFRGETKIYTAVSTYDEIGRPLSVSLPHPEGTETLRYHYSWQGMLQRVSSEQNTYLWNTQHDAFGRTTELHFGNDLADEFVFDGAEEAHRLRSIRTGFREEPSANPDDRTYVRWLDYEEFDANGNLKAIRDLVHFAGDPAQLTQVHSYDQASRVTMSTVCGAGLYFSRFDHDERGNLTEKDDRSYSFGEDGYGPHQLTSVEDAHGVELVDYDQNGNMIRLPGDRTLRYDAQGRLTHVKRHGDLVGEYLYDASGGRVASWTQEDGTTFYFGLFDVRGDEVIRHVSADDRVIASSKVEVLPGYFDPIQQSAGMARSVFGAILFMLFSAAFLTQRRTAAFVAVLFLSTQWTTTAFAQCPLPAPPSSESEILFYHVDHLGTVQLVTDENGGRIEHLVTRPYGELGGAYDQSLQPTPSVASFHFTGQRAEDGTGLVYFGARYYDPGLGMFITHDPQGQYPSPYSYGGGNPLNGVDPDGQFFYLELTGFTLLNILITALVNSAVGAFLGALINVITAAANGASGSEILEAAGQGALSGALAGGISGGLGAIGHVIGFAQAFNFLMVGFSLTRALGSALGDFTTFVIGIAALYALKFAFGRAYDAFGGASGEIEGASCTRVNPGMCKVVEDPKQTFKTLLDDPRVQERARIAWRDTQLGFDDDARMSPVAGSERGFTTYTLEDGSLHFSEPFRSTQNGIDLVIPVVPATQRLSVHTHSISDARYDLSQFRSDLSNGRFDDMRDQAVLTAWGAYRLRHPMFVIRNIAFERAIGLTPVNQPFVGR